MIKEKYDGKRKLIIKDESHIDLDSEEEMDLFLHTKTTNINICRDSLNCEVEFYLAVPDKTVLRCLDIVKMWLVDNPDKSIRGGTRHDDGTIENFEIVPRRG